MAAVAVLLVLLSITVATILNTERGTRWALQRIDAALAADLFVTDMTGTFWRGMEFSSLQVHDQELDFEARTVAIRIDWRGIVFGRFSLRELRAATLQVRSRGNPAPHPAGLTLSMTPLPLTIAVEIGEIGELTFESGGELSRFENISISDVRIRANSIRAGAIAVSTSGIDIAAQEIRITLTDDVPASAQLAWALADGTWSGQGRLQGSLARLNFDQTVTGEYPFRLQGAVQLLRQTEPIIEAVVNWENWAFSDYSLPRGTVQVRGTVNRYDVDYATTVITPDVGELQISGSGSGDLRQLDEFTAQVLSGMAAAELNGSVIWSPSLAGQADFKVSGLLEGAPIAGQGAIELAPQFIRCSSCALAVGKNKLRVDGQLAKGILGWTVSVDAPELHSLRPDIAGLVRGDVRLRGSLEQAEVTGVVNAERLAYGGWRAQSIAIDIEDSTLNVAHIRARVADLHHGDDDYGTFEVRGDGNPDLMQLEINWLIRGLTLDAAGSVTRHGSGLTGRIERATVNEPATGDWNVQHAFAFQFGDAGLLVDPHVWSGASGLLKIFRLESSVEKIAIAADLEGVPLGLANGFLPTGFELLGDASASIDVARQADTWSGTLRWQQQGTVLRVTEEPGEVTDVRVPRAELQADFLDGGVVANASFSIDPGVNTELDLQLSALNADANLRGELRLTGNDWGWITAVIPDIDGFQGSITASVNADGPLLAPTLSGDLRWRDGRLMLPALNVPLEDIDLVVSGAAAGTASVTGSAKAGDGNLLVNGQIDRLMQASRSLTLKLTGTAAKMISWPEYQVWGSPDLTIVGDAQGWQLGGDLVVPRARFAIREIPVEATTISADIVVLGKEEIRAEPTRIAGEVRLTLGSEVRIKALGLDTGLSGELLVHLRHDRPISAEGRIALEKGSLEAQGQKLTIQKGELTFTGPLDNPIVEVRAVRVVDTFDGTVTAGIRLHGRAKDLSTTIFSEPAMNEVDALSYLVIGRPLSEATESEGGDLSGAAVSLGLGQATRLTDQIGRSIGLDQLSLSGDGGDSTMLIAGTKIGSRLYARYAYGIFSNLGTLLLRYKLSDRLTLEAGAGEAQSIDILYSVEKH